MRKIGIVGGIGWPSTIEYYKRICELSQEYHSDKEFLGPAPMPEISIESLDMNFTVNNRGNSNPESWEKCDQYFKDALARLEIAGAEIIALASVTPHSRLEERSKGISASILSVYDALGAFCKRQKITTVLVLGTMPTMASSHLVDAVSTYGVNAFYPASDADKSYLANIIARLYANDTESASSNIEKVVRASLSDVESQNVAVCLACTELPIAFGDNGTKTKFVHNGIVYLNSSMVHAEEIFSACIK